MWIVIGISRDIEYDLRNDFFAHLQRLPLGYFQAHRTGDLMSRATNDLQSVSMLVGFGLLSLVNTVIVYAGTLVAMVRMDPWLTLVALAPYPLIVIVARRYNTRAHAESVAFPTWPARGGQAPAECQPVGRASAAQAYRVATAPTRGRDRPTGHPERRGHSDARDTHERVA